MSGITQEQAERVIERLRASGYVAKFIHGWIDVCEADDSAGNNIYLGDGSPIRLAVVVDALRAEGILPPPAPPQGKVRITLDLDPSLIHLFIDAMNDRDTRLLAQTGGQSAGWRSVIEEAERQVNEWERLNPVSVAEGV